MIITTKDIPIEIGPIIINPSINSIPIEIYNTLILYNQEFKITPVFKSITNIENKLIPIIAIDFEKIKDFYPNIQYPPLLDNYVIIGKKLNPIIKNNSISINGKEFLVYRNTTDLNGYEDYSIFIDFRNYLKISNKTALDQIWINSINNLNTLSKITNQYPNITLIESQKLNYIQETIISSLKILQVIMIIASISIALIASTNTILITTFERIPEFTIILAIGAPRTTIFLSLLLEGLIISSISTIFGISLGIITTTLITNSIQSAINLSIPLTANTLLVTQEILLISIMIGIISSILPAYIASSIDIQSNIRI